MNVSLSNKDRTLLVIFGNLKNNITDMKTGHRNRYHNITESILGTYSFSTWRYLLKVTMPLPDQQVNKSLHQYHCASGITYET